MLRFAEHFVRLGAAEGLVREPFQLCIGSGASESAGLAWVILVLATLLFQDYNC